MGFVIDGTGGHTIGNRIASTVVQTDTAIRLKLNANNTVLSGVTLASNNADLDIEATTALANTRIFGGVGSGTGGAFIPAVSPAAQVTGAVIPGDVRTGSATKTDFAGILLEEQTYTFTGKYSHAPVCVATDTSGSPAAASAVISGTAPNFTLVIESTGTSHTFDYVCVGRD